MRFLNKIVFINSAHIRYAEVGMDGNVHFTGTQGVGKTTLLRALLFFYNCRKDKLGIRTQGQQTFDDFYIPTPSSYIAYEVACGDDEAPFSIILFRHHNRAAFRFVDAPYSKDWFIDDHGAVTSDHLTVRQRIQGAGIDLSGIIERYGQYLDILYGNHNTLQAKDLRKYYLLKSSQYQNIPRIIQNVFLNERVDAGFIKNIIINSITGEDEEIAVDLNFFRSKLIHFNDELRDISLWTDKNRQGIVETRRDADRIIDIARGIRAAQHSLHQQCGMLNHAMNKTERDIPVLQGKIAKKEEAIRLIDDKLRIITSDHDKEQRKIGDQIAVLSRDLKEASDLKKKYLQMGIEELIARAGRLPVLKLEQEQQEHLLSQLTSSHQSIADKYRTLRDRLNLDKQQYLQALRENRNAAVSDFNERESARLSRKTKVEAEIRAKFNSQTSEIDEQLNVYRELLNEQRVQRVQASDSSPMKEEMAECERNIAEAERKTHQLCEKKLKEENRLDTIKNGFELECRQIEVDTVLQIKDLEGSIKSIESRRDEEQHIFESAQESLCEWLDKNIEGWETTIGKIVDEKNVLYSQNLSPRLTDRHSDTIFGISLDMESIEKEVRTPSMIREAIVTLDNDIQSLANEIIRLRDDKDRRIEEEEKKIHRLMKSVQTEIDTTAQEIRVCHQQAKEETLRRDAIKEDERRHIREIVAEFDEKIRELQVNIDNISKERKDIDTKCAKELRKAKKTIDDEAKADKARKDELLKSIDNDIAKYTSGHADRLSQLNKDEAAELADSGVDTDILESTKKEIARLKASIDRIDKERDTITVYRTDCERLLDLVPQKQMEKNRLEEAAARLQEKYAERRRKLELKKSEEGKMLSGLRSTYDKSVESKRQADEFVASKSCPPELKETGSISTDLDCITIISTIKDLTGEILRSTDALKEKTNEFRRRFSPNNTFTFPTAFDTIEDYHRYADSLEEFIINDKIKEFQQVTSNLYRDILSRAASDFNILLGRESEILRIIRDINYDFAKKTFAGVIRSIELRLDRSTIPIITQLQNITEFWNTHQYELGEVNLFSTDEHTDINKESIKYLKSLSAALNNASDMTKLPLAQTFALKFRIMENDNATDWVENIRAVGSEGTDILVKAIINILLISVFKKRAGKADDYKLHCMMDEIGRLADENIQGILNFANERGIYVVNSSPKAHRPFSYRRLYMLSKDKDANTTVQPILSIREAELR